MLVFASPGQGSQSEGFLTPWLEAYPSLQLRLQDYSQAAGRDLVELGTKADEATIRDTANAQRLIVGASLAIYRECFEGRAQGVVGHSVGEFAAAAIAGILSDFDAMRLVGVRADAMAAAAKQADTSMAAVIGGEESHVLSRLDQAGLFAANYNGAGQIVAAGEKSKLSDLIANPPEHSRVIELKVAGAFHTPYMSSAVEALRQAAAATSVADPQIPIWTNRDGTLIRSGAVFVNLLVEQTANSVRWDQCMNELQNQEAKVVELPPAGALSGLLKRGAPAVSAVALKSPSDLLKVDEL